MRLSACRNLKLGPRTGHWYRAIPQEHWETRLSARHSTTAIGRFNVGSVERPSYRILYLAENHLLALFEVRALMGRPEAPVPDPRITWTVLNLNVVLHDVADLTDLNEQKRLGTSAQELTGNWDEYKRSGKAPPQLLGAALFELPALEGFVAPTAIPGVSGGNLIVFPEKLQPSSRVEFRNPITGRLERLRV